MIDRLLERDIERRQSIPLTLLGGTRTNLSALQPTGGTPAYVPLEILPGNVIKFTYDGQSSSAQSYDLRVQMNLQTVPIALVWYLGAFIEEKGSPDTWDRDTKLLTGLAQDLPGTATTVTATWDKTELVIDIEQAGGGSGLDNTTAYFKIGIFYDNLRLPTGLGL